MVYGSSIPCFVFAWIDICSNMMASCCVHSSLPSRNDRHVMATPHQIYEKRKNCLVCLCSDGTDIQLHCDGNYVLTI